MKFTLLIIGLFVIGLINAQTICCPYIDTIKIISSSHILNENISIVTVTTTPNRGNRISYSYNRKNDTFNITSCYFNGALTQLKTYRDTTNLGALPLGTYYINYTARLSYSSISCVAEDSNSRSLSFSAAVIVKTDKIDLNRKFSIYPNPMTDILTIKKNELASGFEVELVNCFGQVCFTGSFTNDTIIDLSTFAKGFYILSISAENNKHSFKITKE